MKIFKNWFFTYFENQKYYNIKILILILVAIILLISLHKYMKINFLRQSL